MRTTATSERNTSMASDLGARQSVLDDFMKGRQDLQPPAASDVDVVAASDRDTRNSSMGSDVGARQSMLDGFMQVRSAPLFPSLPVRLSLSLARYRPSLRSLCRPRLITRHITVGPLRARSLSSPPDGCHRRAIGIAGASADAALNTGQYQRSSAAAHVVRRARHQQREDARHQHGARGGRVRDREQLAEGVVGQVCGGHRGGGGVGRRGGSGRCGACTRRSGSRREEGLPSGGRRLHRRAFWPEKLLTCLHLGGRSRARSGSRPHARARVCASSCASRGSRAD